MDIKYIKNEIERLTILDKEKSKKFGEVFTPQTLIQDMINLIPDTFWEDGNNKILDNSVGIGNFTIYIIEKLLKYHTIEHILNNMIYVCDIQKESLDIFKGLFGETNIYHGSFLNDDCFDNISFGLCIGNPPYNNKRGENTNGNTLWDKFVEKSYKISDRLCFVHPGLWRKPMNKNSKTFNVLKEFQKGNLLYLNINDSNKGLEVFEAGTSFDYYYFEKHTQYDYTTIVDSDDVSLFVDIKNCSFIPNKNILFVYDFIGDDPIEVIFNSKYHAVREYVSKEKTDVFKYPLIHSTPKKEVMYRYSSINNKGHFGIPKLILGESGVDNMVEDPNGIYGMTQGAMGIVNGIKYKHFFQSKTFDKIRKSCLWSNFRLDANLIKLLDKNKIEIFKE